MTGLDLESFLLLLRADLGTWALLGLGSLVLLLGVWLAWGSREALRKCLVLSVAAHAGLALYGSTIPSVFRSLAAGSRDTAERPHIRQVRVATVPEAGGPSTPSRLAALGTASSPATEERQVLSAATPDIVTSPVRLNDSRLKMVRPPGTHGEDILNLAPVTSSFPDRVEIARATPMPSLPLGGATPEPRGQGTASISAPPLPAAAIVPTAAELALVAPETKPRVRAPARAAGSEVLSVLPLTDLRRDSTSRRGSASTPAPAATVSLAQPIPVTRAMPAGGRGGGGLELALADLTGPASGRNLSEVPRFYRSRLDANRSAQAQRSGASAASEQAVESALDWLARHQDADGRWDGGTARYEDGTAVQGDDDFTVHCPAGQTCFGECSYWEADTALTGLALLTYLGAGYTHKDGKFATTVGKGLDFLVEQQKPDGDLRGPSKAVGMYCHAMATLALCEAYALSLDDRYRDPAQKAVGFLVRGRARDGQAWRYLPGAPVGDTSILGWVVMALKSAREIGLDVSGQAELSRGTMVWLDRVATGSDKGLARYQPWEPVTATMTAEAWVCRQFLGVGGPGASSTEAAAYLIQRESDKGDSNFYYWYYGTLALYQHGGPPWTRWNDRLRDRIVGLQRKSGHQSGSWDPDDSMYGARGGRIYCTTLGALTLEVYYRYLRLYDKPNLPADAKVDQVPPALSDRQPRQPPG